MQPVPTKNLAYNPEDPPVITDIFQISPDALAQLASWLGQHLPQNVPISQLQGYNQLLTAKRAVTGIIPATGTTATAGTGFTYTHTNGTGIYVFTFTTSFSATPVVLCNGTTSAGFYTPSSVSTSGFTVTTRNTSATATDMAFNFLAYTVA